MLVKRGVMNVHHTPVVGKIFQKRVSSCSTLGSRGTASASSICGGLILRNPTNEVKDFADKATKCLMVQFHSRCQSQLCSLSPRGLKLLKLNDCQKSFFS
jgi:hypothetical protein